MTRDDVCELVAESPETHGVFENRTETHRPVFCQILSIGRYDYWRAKDNNMDLDLVFRLSHAIDYQGERWIIFNGDRYKIDRTYVTDDGGIELTATKTPPDHYNTTGPSE